MQAQPFFESALGGAGSKYCAGYASCTAAVAALQRTAIVSTQVYNLWSALNAAPSWTLGRTLLASPGAAGSAVSTQLQSYELAASNGWGNYNAAFLSFTARDWHGLTARSNFTWSRAMGTGASAQSSSSQTVLNPWDLHASYGPQPFDIRFVYNLGLLYQVPFFRSQQRACWAACWVDGRLHRCSPRKAERRSKSASAPAARRTRNRSVKNTATATRPTKMPC